MNKRKILTPFIDSHYTVLQSGLRKVQAALVSRSLGNRKISVSERKRKKIGILSICPHSPSRTSFLTSSFLSLKRCRCLSLQLYEKLTSCSELLYCFEYESKISGVLSPFENSMLTHRSLPVQYCSHSKFMWNVRFPIPSGIATRFILS